MMTRSLVKVASKSAAPGQYLGYGLQDVRLCRHLMKAATGCSVSLEYVEDTAIHWLDGSLLLEQSKSALSSNPVLDGAIELWKCFSNWARLCIDGGVDPASTRFHLFVCPSKEGAIVHELHSAQTVQEAKAVLAKIAMKLTPATRLRGPNVKITEFLAAGDDVCVQIIRNFRLIVSDDPLEPIREALRMAVLEESLEDFCAHAIGMAKNRVAELLRTGKPPQLDAETFRRDLRAFIRKHGALGLLVSTTGKPSGPEIEAKLGSSPVFVQQMHRVALRPEFIVRAVSDYLRTEADQTVWAAEGRIVEASIDELHDDLGAHYEVARDEIEEMQSAQDDTSRGRQLFRRCIGYQAPLEGRSVPYYFIPGSFHMLAERARVGWHPRYADFFPGD